MEEIIFKIEIGMPVRPHLEDANIAQNFRSKKWNDK